MEIISGKTVGHDGKSSPSIKKEAYNETAEACMYEDCINHLKEAARIVGWGKTIWQAIEELKERSKLVGSGD